MQYQSIGASSSSVSNHYSYLLKSIWKAKIPSKVKVFTWKVSQGTLLTKSNLAKKEVRLELKCATCNGAMETEGHVFRECSFVTAMWFASL